MHACPPISDEHISLPQWTFYVFCVVQQAGKIVPTKIIRGGKPALPVGQWGTGWCTPQSHTGSRGIFWLLPRVQPPTPAPAPARGRKDQRAAAPQRLRAHGAGHARRPDRGVPPLPPPNSTPPRRGLRFACFKARTPTKPHELPRTTTPHTPHTPHTPGHASSGLHRPGWPSAAPRDGPSPPSLSVGPACGAVAPPSLPLMAGGAVPPGGGGRASAPVALLFFLLSVLLGWAPAVADVAGSRLARLVVPAGQDVLLAVWRDATRMFTHQTKPTGQRPR